MPKVVKKLQLKRAWRGNQPGTIVELQHVGVINTLLKNGTAVEVKQPRQTKKTKRDNRQKSAKSDGSGSGTRDEG